MKLLQAYTNTLNPLPSLASEKKCIREYIFVFASLYSRYVSYSSLGVFVPALIITMIFSLHQICGTYTVILCLENVHFLQISGISVSPLRHTLLLLNNFTLETVLILSIACSTEVVFPGILS